MVLEKFHEIPFTNEKVYCKIDTLTSKVLEDCIEFGHCTKNLIDSNEQGGI